jgi:hypothetical protein
MVPLHDDEAGIVAGACSSQPTHSRFDIGACVLNLPTSLHILPWLLRAGLDTGQAKKICLTTIAATLTPGEGIWNASAPAGTSGDGDDIKAHLGRLFTFRVAADGRQIEWQGTSSSSLHTGRWSWRSKMPLLQLDQLAWVRDRLVMNQGMYV